MEAGKRVVEFDGEAARLNAELKEAKKEDEATT